LKYIVLSSEITPSVYYYFQTRAELDPSLDIQCIDASHCSPFSKSFGSGAVLIISRYIGLRWLWWLYWHHLEFSKIAYFIDDDMPRAFSSHELSWRYGLKTTLKFHLYWFWIKRVKGVMWCSTPELAKRFPELKAKVIAPIYVPKERPQSEAKPVYFYHGTWAHRHEIEWLVPIVREVQKRFPTHTFEIIGNRQVRQLFNGIPRVRVLSGKKWADYKEYAEHVHYQLGLAPCFDSAFNRARSHTKLFDITRVGAVGIYSEGLPYQGKVIDGQTGLLVPNDSRLWIEAISKLLEAPLATRQAMYLNAVQWCGEDATLSEHQLPS